MLFPRKASALLHSKARYKVLVGGRASCKSWTIVNMLIKASTERKVRVLCVREYQSSIEESAKHLLETRINDMGLSDEFVILRTTIKSRITGSEFIFLGLRHNVQSIRSLEGVDICWIEEGQAISKTSLDVLIPTIRKEGSEFYISMNPELEIDEIYQRFVVSPQKDSLVIEMNWSDNPWFSEESNQDRLECEQRDPVGYRNIWEGKCKQSVEGSIFGDMLELAKIEGRITGVPMDATMLVHTGWDLGILASTAIWFFQVTRGGEIHLIDYHEDAGPGLEHYARVLQQKNYTYGNHYAPHDIKARELGTGKSRLEVAAGFGIQFLPVKRIANRDSREDEAGIAVVRETFGRMWFDKIKCKVGLQMISRYRRGFNRAMNEFRPIPVGDSASHCADALRCAMVGYSEVVARKNKIHEPRNRYRGDMAWAG